MAQLQTVVIFSGSFTKSGNFSGYDAGGERIHIPGRAMAAAGLTPDSKIEFPIYTLTKAKEFNKRDADGNISDEKFIREQAGSVFLTEEAIITARNTNQLLDLKAKSALRKAATAAGITEESLAAMEQLA